jgi:hypothetical protein
MADRFLPMPYNPQVIPELQKAQKYKQVNDSYLLRLDQLGGKQEPNHEK